MISLLALLTSFVLVHSTFACNQRISSAYGEIIYTNSTVSCSWTLGESSDSTVTFVIYDKTRTTWHYRCDYQYLEIVDGSNVQLYKKCGLNSEKTVESTGITTLRFVYVSRPRPDFQIHILYFISSINAQCGGFIEARGANDDYIMSPPMENGLILNNVSCYWVFLASYPSIAFSFLELESINGSCEDTVTVAEVVNGNRNVFGTYCGTVPPDTITASSNNLVLEFTSDNDNPFRGFEAHWFHTRGRMILRPGLGHLDISRDGEVGDINEYWLFAGTGKDAVKLVFTRYSLEPSDDCEVDYFRIPIGGRTVTSCTSEIGTIFQEDADDFDIDYSSTSSSQGEGFSLTFYVSRVNESCGGLFTNSTGNLNFPSDGGSYDNMMFCEWGIVGLPGETIRFQILTSDLDQNCYDSLKVYDGMESSAPVLMEVCGSNTGTVLSSSHQLRLVFSSDSINTHNGFTAQWTTGIPDCGEVLTTPSGTFSSDTRAASQSLRCQWHIIGPFDQYIEVNFTHFDLLSSADCDEDYVEIRNGDAADSPLLLRTCDFDTTRTILSVTNNLYIIYHSSASSDRTGVSASYTTAPKSCGGAYTGISGEFNVSLAGEDRCTWKIGGTRGSVSSLLFKSFNLQSSNDCNDEFIEVHDGNGTRLLRACGTDLPNIARGSPLNPLIVTFRSFITSTANFSAVFHIGNERCGSLEISDHGMIAPPKGADGGYLHDLECSWLIYGQAGQRVLLYLSQVHMEDEDPLDVYDGLSSSSLLVFRAHIETGIPQPFTSTGRGLFLEFSSTEYHGNDVAYEGFVAHYEIIDEPLEKEILTSDINIISESRDGSSGVIHREWHIVGAPGSTLEIYFTEFHLDTIQGCNVDYFEIRDGWHANSPLIMRSCDFSIGTIYKYNVSEAFIIFHSEPISRGDGFTFGYYMGKGIDGCGGLIVSSEGDISYPPDEEEYGNDITCEWLLMGLQNETIHFNVTETDLANNCYDTLSVYDGLPDQQRLMRLCEHHTDNVQSSSNRLSVVFESDDYERAPGFTGRWLIGFDGCGKVFTDPSGQFSSNSKPQNEDLRCQWQITGKFGATIELNFTEYDLGVNCDLDYVKIRGGVCQDSPLECKLCFTDTERSFTSLDDQVFIEYYSSQNSQATGISVHYEIRELTTTSTSTTTSTTTTTPTTTTTSTTTEESAAPTTPEESAALSTPEQSAAVTTPGSEQCETCQENRGNAGAIQKVVIHLND